MAYYDVWDLILAIVTTIWDVVTIGVLSMVFISVDDLCLKFTMILVIVALIILLVQVWDTIFGTLCPLTFEDIIEIFKKKKK